MRLGNSDAVIVQDAGRSIPERHLRVKGSKVWSVSSVRAHSRMEVSKEPELASAPGKQEEQGDVPVMIATSPARRPRGYDPER